MRRDATQRRASPILNVDRDVMSRPEVVPKIQQGHERGWMDEVDTVMEPGDCGTQWRCILQVLGDDEIGPNSASCVPEPGVVWVGVRLRPRPAHGALYP